MAVKNDGCPIKLSKLQINKFTKKTLNKKSKNKKNNKPIALVMVGGPGSGKTSAKVNSLMKLNMKTNNIVTIDPDIISSELFDNINICRPEVNKIGKYWKDTAIKHKHNVVIDGTGRDFEHTYKEQIHFLKNKGYKVFVCVNILNITKALPRIRGRTKKIGRIVPISWARNTYNQLKEAYHKYIDLDCEKVDGIFVYDNKDKLKLIFKSTCNKQNKKEIICYEPNYKFVREICKSKKNNITAKKQKKNSTKKNMKKK